MEGQAKFVFLDADDQASRIALNLDNVNWIAFDGDQFNAKSAKIHFSGQTEELQIHDNQAAFLQGEIDSIVLKRNLVERAGVSPTPRRPGPRRSGK